MMHCEEYLLQLNARHDGELSAEQCAELESHLAGCSHCRAAAEGFEAIDADLRQAFARRRASAAALTERVLAEVRAMAAPAEIVPAASQRRTRLLGELSLADWGRTLLATAAGFLLAVALLRTSTSPGTNPGHVLTASTAGGRPAGRLVVASGPVQMRATNQMPFLGCVDGSPIKPASVLRTGDNARCELSLEGGNMVRLDRNTEITLHRPDRVEVNSGRLWAASKAAQPIEIVTFGCSIKSRTPSEVAVERQPKMARLIVVNGAVNVSAGKESKTLERGELVEVADGKLKEPQRENDPLLETAWMNGMLAGRSAGQQEFNQRVQGLLARIGSAKLSLLYEDELRRLGDGGVPPLLAFLKTTREKPEEPRRIVAARIAADVAQPRRIGDLVTLLEDPSAEVRYHAARGLERLTGRDQGLTPEAWKADSHEKRDAAQQEWQEWWSANSDRYAEVRSVPMFRSALRPATVAVS
jgi:hypothetical protein